MFSYFPISDENGEDLLLPGLRRCYRSRFVQSEPLLLTRAPGRVNIIGEHIDYCGYGVLPMAIDRHTFILIGKRKCGSNIHLASTDAEFEDHIFDPNTMDIASVPLRWYKYVMCGLYAVKSLFPSLVFKGVNMLVSGDLPIGCGLSSSSSLVVCSALAISAIHEVKIEKKVLAAECAVVERYIGTAGGGMDQSISCLAERGMAKYITFNPLMTENVKLPEEGVFVVANSLSSHRKAEKPQYNTRVVECRIGVKILASKLGVRESVSTPIDLEGAASLTKGELIDAVKSYLKEGGYNQDEVVKILGISHDELLRDILTPNTQDVARFDPRRRLLHVFQEAERVKCFVELCKGTHKLSDLGALMNESHNSCRDLYDCSSLAQDTLVDTMRRCGCAGARMTGAGWGGCVVALVHQKDVKLFVKRVADEYYADGPKDITDHMFISKPASGAGIVTLLLQ